MTPNALRAGLLTIGFWLASCDGGVRVAAQTAQPSPLASPAPSVPLPAPQAAPSPKGIVLNVDRHRLTMAPGASEQVHVFGASTVDVRSTFDGIAVRYDEPSRTLQIVARQLGSGSIEISDARGETESIAVAVVPPAGVVPPSILIALLGTPTPEFALDQIRAKLRQTAQLPPGCRASVALKSADVPALDKPSLSFDVAVKLSGPNYADVSGTSTVRLTIDPGLVTRDPVTLLYSDDPETASADGLLFGSTVPIDAGHSARVYAYHEAADAGRNLFLVIRTTGKAARVQLVGASIGPSGDYNCVGHESTMFYLQRRAHREGVGVDVTASQPFVLQLNARAMPPRTLVVGLFDVHVASGDPVAISIVTASGTRDPLGLVGGSELGSDGHHRRGEYGLQSAKPVVLSYTVGGDDAVTSIGALQGDPSTSQFPSVRTGGSPLNGEYGIVRSVRLDLKNPTPSVRIVYFYEVPANGADTTTMWFDGDPAPLEMTRIGDPNTRYLLRAFTLQPQQSLSVNLTFMPDGASWYPVQLGLSATVPAPAPAATFGACLDAVKPTAG